ncbi:MAG: hypothetical protein L0312_06080, partial [Acidobacteria bacterium]|nr:hypothetical protein [Acidobacteriota bacterium]
MDEELEARQRFGSIERNSGAALGIALPTFRAESFMLLGGELLNRRRFLHTTGLPSAVSNQLCS